MNNFNLLVTIEDVKNVGIDLQTDLGEQADYVNFWIKRQQDIILEYIARHIAEGPLGVQRILQSDPCKRVVQEAIIEQIYMLKQANYIDPSVVANSKDEKASPTIAPLAVLKLENAGLLYGGFGRGGFYGGI